MGAGAQKVEEMAWPDGCHHHPACLTCPFAECLFDLSPVERSRAIEQRQAKAIKRLTARGATQAEAAAQLGISKRAVQRRLTKART